VYAPSPPAAEEERPLQLGISACLLGEAVRYDGGHKRCTALLARFASRVQWVPVCPEVEAGLGVPRAPLRLEQQGVGARVVGIQDRRDYTRALTRCAQAGRFYRAALDLAGLVLKQRSPSCGPGDAPLHDVQGRVLEVHDGAFAAAVGEAFPWLPLAGDEELQDAAGRENFLVRAQAHAAFRRVLAGVGSLRSFHRRRRSLVSLRAGEVAPLRACCERDDRLSYARSFFAILQRRPAPQDHQRLLAQLAGFIAERAPPPWPRQVEACVDAYRNGASNLAVAARVLAGAVEAVGLFELAGDAYLEPGALRMQEYEEL